MCLPQMFLQNDIAIGLGIGTLEDNPQDSREITFEEAINLLQKGELRDTRGALPWGSNYTLLMEIARGDDFTYAVYKPRRGERPLWDFPDGSLYKREVAAFEVSEMLGWQLVPPTIARSGPYGIGMVQMFIPHDTEQHYFTFSDEQKDQLARFALFDYIINNADRKGGHCLLDNAGRIWAIDHGVSFHTQYKLRTVIWDFAGVRIPDELMRDMQNLCEIVESTSGCERLDSLLSPLEVDALRKRIHRLVDSKTFPEAGMGRSYPWPPV